MPPDSTVALGLALLVGLLVGAALVGVALAGVLRSRARVRLELARAEERLSAHSDKVAGLEAAERRLEQAFASVGARTLRENNEAFLTLARQTLDTALTHARGDAEKRQVAVEGLVQPLKEILDKQAALVGELERRRENAYAGIEAHLTSIASTHEKLQSETGRLVSALRRPEQRGRWGELQLRNAVELAGMSEHCDFSVQVTAGSDEGRFRPDLVVRLPGGGQVVVDSKVALDAYLDALQPDSDHAACMARHADQVAKHFKQLSSKKYWEQFEHTPPVVVMFMPLESALVAALEIKPELHSDAMRERVLIATPTLLVAVLRAIAYGWQQEAVSRNASEIARAGRDLYDRLATFAEHFERVGKGLHDALDKYNKGVGSLEKMVLPSARKLKELHASAEDAVVTEPAVLTLELRRLVAPELAARGDRGLAARGDLGEA